MALLAAGLGIGAAAAAGGIAATVKANRVNTKPQGVTYGGTKEKQQALEDSYLAGIDQGNGQLTQGFGNLETSRKNALKLSGAGQLIQEQAYRLNQVGVDNKGGAILDAYKPGAVAQAQAKQAIDANTAASFGAARSGGALGLRNALNANATTGAQTAQALAVQRAQEEQAQVAQQVAQANTNQQQMFQADQQKAAQKAQLLGIGTTAQAAGVNAGTQASNAQTQAGLTNQNQWLGQEQNLNDQQGQLNLAYEEARRAAAEAKASRWANMGSSLISGGLGMAGGAMRGGK